MLLKHNLYKKAVAVIESCHTEQQFEAALQYVNLLRKFIGEDYYDGLMAIWKDHYKLECNGDTQP